jgi:uncharacterized iron-regulated membrane protein
VPDVGRPSQGRRFLREPQTLLFRRALFQIHLWVGIATGLYIAIIALTGSILVYRNEIYRAFSPQPRLVADAGTPLSADDLEAAVRLTFPDARIVVVEPGPTPGHAADVTLEIDGERTRRLVHPATGADLGPTLPLGYRVSAWMLDLHDNLLGGPTGRRVNGIGALALLVLCATGLIVWWPGVSRWRRSVLVDVRANWKRLNWSLHSVLGFWFFAFILMWSLTGVYLSLPDQVSAILDYIEPLDEANPVERVVDRIQYWLAYLHFGRLGGRGIPGCGRGLCDSITKATWAAVGVVPVVMAVTGAVMWWNRVGGPALRRRMPRLTLRAGLRPRTPADSTATTIR